MRAISHAFAGNPIIPGKRVNADSQWLESVMSGRKGVVRILPLVDGRPLVMSSSSSSSAQPWTLTWLSLDDFAMRTSSNLKSSAEKFSGDSPGQSVNVDNDKLRELSLGWKNNDKLVYLGERNEVSYFAIDASDLSRAGEDGSSVAVASLLTGAFKGTSFIDLRRLMTGSNWENKESMGELSIAGHARAMLEWHKQAQYCGVCGNQTLAVEAGQRRECSSTTCKRKLYPRIDPVVIMLIIDKERDKVILGRQSRFVSNLWSCLAGFIEPGESLEEAVKRETREEVGIEVGEICYHSSQPWPVGRSSMSCQLMVGFWAYATTFDIHVDMKELEDAKWYSREDVRKSLAHTEYRFAQEAKANEAGAIDRAKPVGSLEETVAINIPGPYAIAHHLISTWVDRGLEEVNFPCVWGRSIGYSAVSVLTPNDS